MADNRSRCPVPLCSNNRSGKQMHGALSWHAIPKNKDLRREWLAKMTRDLDTKIPLKKFSKVCSVHFKKSDFRLVLNSSRAKVFLKPNVVPSIFPWSSETKNAEAPANRVKNSSHTLPNETNAEIVFQDPTSTDSTLYPVQNILPYQLVVPELEEIDNNSNSKDQSSIRFLEIKSKTKTQSTQCLITPSLVGKKDERLIWRHDNCVRGPKGPSRTVAMQAGLNLHGKINAAVQCKIKPRCVDAGVQCSRFQLGLEEPVRKNIEVDSRKRTLCLSVDSPKKRKIAVCDKVEEKVDVEQAELGVVEDDEEYDGMFRIMAAMARESTLQEVLMSDGSLKQQPPSKDQLSKLKCLAMDQKLNGVCDGTGNRWSSATMQLAMEIYERSPATYHRLRYFNLLKLPCVKSLAKGDCVSGNDCEIIDPMEELFACINGTEKAKQESDCEEIFILSGSSADRSNTDEDGTIN